MTAIISDFTANKLRIGSPIEALVVHEVQGCYKKKLIGKRIVVTDMRGTRWFLQTGKIDLESTYFVFCQYTHFGPGVGKLLPGGPH